MAAVRWMVALLAVVVAALVFARPASAAAPWVDRSLTLPRLVFSGDAGFGVAHQRFARVDTTGAGMNLEAALGITDAIEIGLRTGIRFGDDGRTLSADAYGRTLFTETFGTNGDTVANPELRARWALYSGRIVEVGLDGRFYMPVEQGAHAGVMFGVPLAFHVGNFMRIDTGVYVPVVFAPDIGTVISVPGYFWFQVSHRVWLGPMIALRHVSPGPVRSHDDVLAGLGVGYQVASAIDLKWMLLFPNVNADVDRARVWGAGFGLQFRLGE